MTTAPEVVVLDVNETLSELEPLRAATLRDGFALAAAGRAQAFPARLTALA
jgi:hypothetical protein